MRRDRKGGYGPEGEKPEADGASRQDGAKPNVPAASPGGARVPGDAATDLGSPPGVPDSVRKKHSPLKEKQEAGVPPRAVAEAKASERAAEEEGAPLTPKPAVSHTYAKEDALLKAAAAAQEFERRHREQIFAVPGPTQAPDPVQASFQPGDYTSLL